VVLYLVYNILKLILIYTFWNKGKLNSKAGVVLIILVIYQYINRDIINSPNTPTPPTKSLSEPVK
jgi:hypothetical protein